MFIGFVRYAICSLLNKSRNVNDYDRWKFGRGKNLHHFHHTHTLTHTIFLLSIGLDSLWVGGCFMSSDLADFRFHRILSISLSFSCKIFVVEPSLMLFYASLFAQQLPIVKKHLFDHSFARNFSRRFGHHTHTHSSTYNNKGNDNKNFVWVPFNFNSVISQFRVPFTSLLFAYFPT